MDWPFRSRFAAALSFLAFSDVSGATSPKPPKPVVTGFAANYPTVGMYGGSITVSAAVANATTCSLSSNKSLAGLPSPIDCSNGAVSQTIAFPANPGKKAFIYKLTLAATGAENQEGQGHDHG